VERVRGNKRKADWIEPNPELADYAESGQLIVAWREVKAFLREESSAEQLREYNERGLLRRATPSTGGAIVVGHSEASVEERGAAPRA
jgi:hypothetical protein